jgi:hypothetical protein
MIGILIRAIDTISLVSASIDDKCWKKGYPVNIIPNGEFSGDMRPPRFCMIRISNKSIADIEELRPLLEMGTTKRRKYRYNATAIDNALLMNNGYIDVTVVAFLSNMILV